MPRQGRVHWESIVHSIYAAHLSSKVLSRTKDRGGLFLVGSPGILKTDMLGVLDERYTDVAMLTDLNVKSFAKHLRGKFAAGEYTTMVLPDVGKLYQRDPATASNVEGTLNALVAEGFRYASWENPNDTRVVARATVLGAMVPELKSAHLNDWELSGFARRFLFAVVEMENKAVIDKAIDHDHRFEWGAVWPPDPDAMIPNTTTLQERKEIGALVGHQPKPNALQKLLLVKMLAVLKWWYPQIGRSERAAMETIRDFGKTLGPLGAVIYGLKLPAVLVPNGKGHRAGKGRRRRSRG